MPRPVTSYSDIFFQSGGKFRFNLGPNLGPIWNQIWVQFGTKFGSNLGPNQGPFWDQIWSNFGPKMRSKGVHNRINFGAEMWPIWGQFGFHFQLQGCPFCDFAMVNFGFKRGPFLGLPRNLRGDHVVGGSPPSSVGDVFSRGKCRIF